MRTAYLGTSEFAAAILEELAKTSHRPALVVTRPDRPRGRGRQLSPPPVATRARELGLPVIQPEKLHEPEVLAQISEVQPEALCVCAYGVLIREPLLSDFELINVHPSLLPRWRGAAPIERALMAGDDETGVSIMKLTAGLDSGPVYMQESVRIGGEDDYGTLAQRLQPLSAKLLIKTLDELPDAESQDEDAVTYADKIGPIDRLLDPSHTPQELERTVRALRPHIGARIQFPDGEFLGVWDAQPLEHSLDGQPLRLHVQDGRLLMSCTDGTLELTEIQPPGGRRMRTEDWLRGRPDASRINFEIAPAVSSDSASN